MLELSLWSELSWYSSPHFLLHLAAWTRTFADIFGAMGWINFKDMQQRRRTIAILAWIIPFLWALIYILIREPVVMVIIGGIITSIILFIVIFAVYNFRYKRLDPAFYSECQL